ncbi:uncharacterized protein FFC1_03171 [Fusarium fujikuroi]|nr:uncharacterized protein FFC1_03171 [Fusarium fujikuroi]
MCILIR